jgi:predicted amidohydrolase
MSSSLLDDRRPVRAIADSPANVAWAWFGLITTAGISVGAGHWFAPAAWLGVMLLAAALRTPRPVRQLVIGLVAAGLAQLAVGHPWVFEGVGYYLPGGSATARWVLLPLALLWIAPLCAALGLAVLAAWRLRCPVWLWLPAAWAAGEAGFTWLFDLDFNAWLYTQYRVQPVLAAVGHWGWWPALGLCLASAAAIGEAVSGRAWRPALVGALGLVALAAAPPLAGAGPAAFHGLGAVHLADLRVMPRQAPAGVSVLLWPELADTQRPILDETIPPGTYIEPPLRAPGVSHLYGLKTRSGRANYNALLALDPAGQVLGLRAKSRMFPLTERPFLGYQPLGMTRYERGTRAPVLALAGRRFGTLLCLEGSDSGLAAEARRAGAEILVVAASERVGQASPLAQEQLLATSVLRAVETGLPVARASRWGYAAFIDRDGRILARSALGTNGVLTIGADEARPALPPTPTAGPPGGLAILYDEATPAMLPQVPGSLGVRLAVGQVGVPADTVIVSGDSRPPRYLGRSPEVLASAIAAFHPKLVVLDTCYGASSPLLDALAARTDAWVVGAAHRIPAAGLRYQPDFFTEPSAERRAWAVRLDPSYPLLRWRLDRPALQAAEAAVATMTPTERRRRTQALRPRLVRINLAGRPAPDGRILVVDPDSRR